MKHDPLCPWRQAEESDGPERWLAGAAVCECYLISKVREDMLRRCEEAAYTDLLALEDSMREAFGKGSDAARIVAGYRSAMPGFRKFYEEKP